MKEPHLELEQKFGYPRALIAGVDEVGRGCLAGPVVAGASILPAVIDTYARPWILEIRDSKLLTASKREALAPLLQNWVLAWSLGVASVEEIDRLNIHYAVHLAMRRAVEGLCARPNHVLVDGKFPPKELGFPVTAVVKGDRSSLSIASASIIAKVWRDHQMQELEVLYPGYGLAVHKGYPTPMHKERLIAQGASPIHRRSFSPVAECLASGC